MALHGHDNTIARQLASERLRGRRRRVHTIRRRVVGIGVAMFLALWAVIFSQLVSAHVTTVARAKSVASVAPHTSAATSAGTTSAGSATTSSGSGGSSSGSGTTSAVTTSQS